MAEFERKSHLASELTHEHLSSELKLLESSEGDQGLGGVEEIDSV